MDKYIDSMNIVIDFLKEVGKTEEMIQSSKEITECKKMKKLSGSIMKCKQNLNQQVVIASESTMK